MTYDTGKRERIIALLKNNPERAFTVKEIADRLLPDGRGTSTVHRIVASLQSEGALRLVASENKGAPRYQYLGHGCSHHLHLVCRECGALSHLDKETSHALEEKIMHTSGFAVEGGALLLGVCRKCDESRALKNG